MCIEGVLMYSYSAMIRNIRDHREKRKEIPKNIDKTEHLFYS